MTSLVQNFNQVNIHYLPSLATERVLDVNRISVHERQAIMSDHEKDSVQSFSTVQQDTNGDSQEEGSCLPHINIDPKELNIGIRKEVEKTSVQSDEKEEEALEKSGKTCTDDAGERLVSVSKEKVKSASEDSLPQENDSHSITETTITNDCLSSQDKSAKEHGNYVQSEPLQNADTCPDDSLVSGAGDNLLTSTVPTSNGVDGLENSKDKNTEVNSGEKDVVAKPEDAHYDTETNNSDSLQFDEPSDEGLNANSEATSQSEEQKKECIKKANSQSESTSPSDVTESAVVTDDSNKNQNNNSQSLPLHCTTSFTSVSQNGHLSPTSGGLSNGVGGDHSVSSSPGTSTSSLSSTLSQTAVPGPMSPGSGPASATPAGPHTQHPAHTRVNTPPNNLQCPIHTVYNHQASSPTRFSPNGPSRGESPHSGASGPGSPPSQQHVVHVHVNQGETFSVRVGDQIQHIQGPATVRMVSNNGPPLPMPMQVPPGHMVQQIVDEHGILTHVILSPQPPGMPGSPMTVGYYGGPNNGAQYYPPYGPPYPSSPQYSTHHHPHPGAGTPPHMHPGVHHAHIHPPPPSHNCNNHASAHSAGPSSSPANHHLDERTVRQRDKMKAKYDRRVQDGYYQPGPAQSRRTKSKPNKGVSQTMATSSTSPTQNGDDIEEERRELQQQLTSMPAPKISDVEARSALIQLDSPDYDQSVYDLINPADFCYELLLSEKGRDGKYKPVYTGDATEITLKDLKPATEYFLKASTLLDDIRGSPTEPVSFKTLCCEPDPPQAPRLSQKTKTSITLKWNSTAENGARIQTYTLECDQGQGEGHFVEVYDGQSRQFRLSKLQASTRYLFRLAAVNSMGKSAYSETSSFYTSGSVPSQPDPPMLSEAFVNALTISWIKRPNDDDFILHMEDECTGHGFITVYNGANLSHIVKTLRRNSEYRFKLAARNEEGQGKWSDIVCYKTLPDRPGPPIKLQSKGKVYAHSFRVTWDPPKDDGGSEVTSYTLEMDDGNGGYDVVYEGPERECACERLTPGHSYRVRARCRSAGGDSDYSECCTITTQAVAPGQCQPPKLQGKPKASSLHLRWNYPEKDGGAAVTDFTAQMSFPDNTSREVYRGRDLDCIVAGLSPGRPYLFQVRAHNKAGAGPWSDPLEVVSGAGVPDAPKAPTVTCRSPHSAVISWEEPVNNGATIAEYKLEWLQRADFDFIQLYLGSSQSYEVRGLTPASQYSFRVQAINSAGSGPFSSPVTCVTPSSSPAAVISIRYAAAATTIALTWKEPNCNGSEIIAYNIDIGEKNLIVVSSITEHTLEGLSPETTYKIRIQAVNEIGDGAFSTPIKVTTRALPPNPPRLECISTLPNSLKLRWGDGRNQDMVKYTLEMEKEDGSFVAIHTGPAHTHKVNKLSELTSYEFRIFASNDAGDGPYSDTFTFTTTKAPPPALKAPRVSETGLNHCVLEWTGIKPIGSDYIHYILQVQALAAKEVEYREVYRGPNTSYRLTNLSPCTEYQARVCAVRQSTSRSGDITGAFSPGIVFSTQSPEPQRTVITKTEQTKILERKQLTDQQWAMIILCGFALFAVLVAFIAQQIISYTSHTSSRQ